MEVSDTALVQVKREMEFSEVQHFGSMLVPNRTVLLEPLQAYTQSIIMGICRLPREQESLGIGPVEVLILFRQVRRFMDLVFPLAQDQALNLRNDARRHGVDGARPALESGDRSLIETPGSAKEAKGFLKHFRKKRNDEGRRSISRGAQPGIPYKSVCQF